MKASAKERAAALLRTMTAEEKLRQLCADMLFEVAADYETRRDPRLGSYRNPGHFMHYQRETPAPPHAVAARINRDVELSMASSLRAIPPIENGEALHGAQWGMGTCFPQPIAMASSFDPALMEQVAGMIGAECAAVGVRQVFAPVVNVVRDCRWGRTVETFGEDVKLSSDFGAAMCRGLVGNGVIPTPKHFADNYAAGGRDSNYSETSERTLREVFLPPFKACFDAGALSVMAAYNAWDGIPCTANPRLLTEILREEWGFEGFVVSDYSGAENLAEQHGLAASVPEALAMAVKAGLDVILPFNRYDDVKAAFDEGLLPEEALDRAVLRILTAKFAIGLFDRPFCDASAADAVVRSPAHRALALKAAEESIVLLKNEGLLPLKKERIRRIGVFGRSAGLIPVGSNYSGPYGTPWVGEDAPTPLQALKNYLGEETEILYADTAEIPAVAPTCDVCLYFTSLLEGEGADRSDLRLPAVSAHETRASDGGLIVDQAVQEIREDQETAILALTRANPNTAVILLNGAPVDMTAWLDKTNAVLEAWYPGEQGAKALTRILFGEVSPSAKLPITFPKHVGQAPLFYAHKPSGRGYGYCNDDGQPRYPFGYGLSYTSFEIADAAIKVEPQEIELSFAVKNTGAFDGTEVVQLYLSSRHCGVVRPVKELKAYTRVSVKAGLQTKASLKLKLSDFSFYNAAMAFGPHDGDHTVCLGTSSEDIAASFAVKTRGGALLP